MRIGDRRSRTGVALGLALLGALVLATATQAAPDKQVAPDKPAANVSDLRTYFAQCFQPPGVAANSRVTFYFSLNNRGGIIGRPRTTWLGFTGAEAEKAKHVAEFTGAFDKCLPVALDRRMAAAIPGEIYYLQYVVGPDGRDQQVLLRPFGSHGGVAPAAPLNVGPDVSPGEQGPPPVDPRRFHPFLPRPGTGRFFNPPIYGPIGRLRHP